MAGCKPIDPFTTSFAASPAVDCAIEEISPPVSILDQVALGRILELVQKGGAGLLGQMVDHYVLRTPELLAELEQALERNDSEGVRVAAHTLKSSSLTMGVARLAELGRAMETDHADLTKVRQHFCLSDHALAEAEQALNELRKSQSKGEHHE